MFIQHLEFSGHCNTLPPLLPWGDFSPSSPKTMEERFSDHLSKKFQKKQENRMGFRPSDEIVASCGHPSETTLKIHNLAQQ